MTLVRKLATLLRVERKKIFWMSKLLDTKNVKADEMMGCLLEVLNRLSDPREWPNLGLNCLGLFEGDMDFGIAIVFLHMITELHLNEYPCSDVVAADTATGDINVLVAECRKLSRYMMYLLVTHPTLLPLNISSVDALKRFQNLPEDDIGTHLQNLYPQPGKETLEEIKEVWIRLIIYAAFKSRPDIHMAQLARGGEFLTFVWLFLAKNGFGSHFNDTKIELIRGVRGPSARMVYAIDTSR
ncbi:uncharacterized protein LOC133896037 [Phragmites australis]|uniref:uncharacterized protein LOC133896037 n=1 Tax=Phragmites australis TaxID=29695 RepID=UPI002D796AAE|nr:uncharacterized protein LOC133896037 [Phragmites australis]